MSGSVPEFRSFRDFYPFYLTEHQRRGTKICHLLGTTSFLGFLIASLLERRPLFFACGVFAAYAFAWVSHFFIEKNRPATFRYPFYSLAGDFRMFFELLTGKIPL